ncbi:unnamed protein product [Amoebophrya sp. A120]|nr:unnamed protein product [Amoebophrya sp. A120]|eukprot:GSA120T00000171001.1
MKRDKRENKTIQGGKNNATHGGDERNQPEAKRQKHEKPSAVQMYSGKQGGRDWTLSVALPASIVANAQSHELRSYLVAQIARALTIYGVDEVVLYEDQQELVNQGDGGEMGGTNNTFSSSWDNTSNTWNYDTNSWAGAGGATAKPKKGRDTTTSAEDAGAAAAGEADAEEKGKNGEEEAEKKHSWALNFFARNLQYLETPQYLRKILFGMHPDLKFAGLQNPLDAPHHLRKGEQIKYREGVILEERHFPYAKPSADGVFVCCGLDYPVWCEEGHGATAGVRVTVKLLQDVTYKDGSVAGEIVSPSTPRTEDGLYWGYQTRVCHSLQEVFDHTPLVVEETTSGSGGDHPEAAGKEVSKRRQALNLSFDSYRHYDLVLGTSERGRAINDEFASAKKKLQFRHCLVLFGSLGGLEAVMKDDLFTKIEKEYQIAHPAKRGENKKNHVCGNPRMICHHYLNTCPFQTSRTIRAEEALLITLANLDRFLDK